MAISQSDALTASGLRLDSLSHIALPVRNLDRAELFYIQVLGAKFVDRVDVPNMPPERNYASRLDVRWGVVDLQLYKQPYGEPTIDQAHPHHAFTTRGRMIDQWVDHFASWGIPSVVVCRQHGKVGDPWILGLFRRDVVGRPHDHVRAGQPAHRLRTGGERGQAEVEDLHHAKRAAP